MLNTADVCVNSDVANEMNTKCVDLYTLSGIIMQELGDEGCLYLFCSTDDRSHFSIEGAEVMASTIINSILLNKFIGVGHYEN